MTYSEIREKYKGKSIGDLTFVNPGVIKRNVFQGYDLECKCACGNRVMMTAKQFDNRSRLNCGCKSKHRSIIKKGDEFGRLTSINSHKKVLGMGEFKCKCGRKIRLHLIDVYMGVIDSCGCGKYGPSTVAPELYKKYRRMHEVCYNSSNKDFRLFGLMGIKVDPAFDTFAGFLDWAIHHTPFQENKNMILKRLDISGDYSPRNCIIANKDGKILLKWKKKSS